MTELGYFASRRPVQFGGPGSGPRNREGGVGEIPRHSGGVESRGKDTTPDSVKYDYTNNLLAASGISDAQIADRDLSGENLAHAKLPGANLSGFDLTGTDLSNATLTSVNLEGAILKGTNFAGANLFGSNLSDSDLRKADLSGADCTHCDFRGADVRDVNLMNATLESAHLENTNLAGVRLDGANLTGGLLNQTDLSAASLAGTNLSGAALSGAQLGSAYMRQADLSKANLSGAELISTDLTDANLRYADLSGANIRGAVLDGADLTGANINRTDLSGVDLSRAVGVEDSRGSGGRVAAGVRDAQGLGGGSRNRAGGVGVLVRGYFASKRPQHFGGPGSGPRNREGGVGELDREGVDIVAKGLGAMIDSHDRGERKEKRDMTKEERRAARSEKHRQQREERIMRDNQARRENGGKQTGVSKAAAKDFEQRFAKAFETPKLAEYTAFVTHYTAPEIEGMKSVLTENDGQTGMLVKDHGDGRIEGTGLFNTDGEGAGAALLDKAVAEQGVNYLECYGDHLKDIYEKAGFRVDTTDAFNSEYAAPNWNYADHDNPNYYTLSLPSDGTASFADVSSNTMTPSFQEILSDPVALRAEAKAKADPEWWAKYGEKSFDAALGLFGISSGSQESQPTGE